jgi:hypothetical protein
MRIFHARANQFGSEPRHVMRFYLQPPGGVHEKVVRPYDVFPEGGAYSVVGQTVSLQKRIIGVNWTTDFSVHHRVAVLVSACLLQRA